MNTTILPHERAKKVIAAHTKGVICAGEVWNQFVDFVTPDTVIDWTAQLTPELDLYFRRLANEADFELYGHEQQRAALRLLIDQYEKPTA